MEKDAGLVKVSKLKKKLHENLMSKILFLLIGNFILEIRSSLKFDI